MKKENILRKYSTRALSSLILGVAILVAGMLSGNQLLAQTRTLSVSIIGNGSVNTTVSSVPDPGPYPDDTEVDLEAVADPGWVFTGWSEDLSGTTNPTSITMGGNRDVTATFKEILYLTVNDDGHGSVTKLPNLSSYLTGDIVALTPVADGGYTFFNWTGDISGSDNPALVTMNTDMTINANFVNEIYPLTTTQTGSGSISRNPSAASYESFTLVQLTANALPGWSFDSWSGNLSGNANPANIYMDGPKSVHALFTQNTYTLTLNSSAGGSASKDPDLSSYLSGSDVEITATPLGGWTFTGWSGDLTGLTNPATVSMDENKLITANFAENAYELTVQTDGTPLATVSPASPVMVTHGDSRVIQVTYIPPGWEFVEWTVTGGAGMAGASITNKDLTTTTVTLTTGPATVEASFQLKEYTLTVIPDGTPGAEVSPKNPILVTHGQANPISVVKVPDGFQFKQWIITTGTGVSIDDVSNADTEVTLTDGNATIQATFELKKYELDLITDMTPGASVLPNTTTEVTHGVPQLIYAFGPTSHKFSQWTPVTGTVDIANDTMATTTATLNTDNVTLRANFELKTYRLTVWTDGTPGVVVSPATPVTVTHGLPRLISAVTIPDGYKLKNWSIISGQVSFANDTMETTTATVVNGNAIIRANFEKKKYQLTLITEAIPGAAVSPPNPVMVTHGEPRVISVTSIPLGYKFKNWEQVSGVVTLGNDTLETTTATLTENDVVLRATFELKKYTLGLLTDGTPGATVSPALPFVVEHGVPQVISANTIPLGYKFSNWSQLSGTAIIENDTMATTSATLNFGNATLVANFKKVLEVHDIEIPNSVMKINDPVTAVITVSDDAGTPYFLVAGSIGGYPLSNFTRVTSTSYRATFIITLDGNSYDALRDIPVTNLILSDGLNQNLPYNHPIVQNRDAIDAKLPVVNTMTVASGFRSVGDIITLNINADSTHYEIGPLTTINGVAVSAPNVTFTETGNGNYRLRYTIMEGENDVAEGKLEASVFLVKPSLNTNMLPFTIIAPNTLRIDANSPVVTRMEVSNDEVGIGQTVQLVISSDGAGYQGGAGTIINGIPLNSPRVNLEEQTGGLYVLNYMVDLGDNNVSPGNLNATVIMTDSAENNSVAYSLIQDNSLEIYTDPPTADLAAPPAVCEGEALDLNVFLSGRGPWGFDLNDGSQVNSYKFIETSPFIISGSLDQNTTFTIDSVWDKNGVVNTGSSVNVRVNQKADLVIMNLGTGYTVEADPFQLVGLPSGGAFDGPGVVKTGDAYFFYPDIAGTENSPHTIYYSYENLNGCTSLDSGLVFILTAEGDIYIPDSAMCNNSDPVTVTASNLAGATGSFTLENLSMQQVDGLSDNGDNTAVLTPVLMDPGQYVIVYEYFNGIPLFIRDTISIISVEIPEFLNLDTLYCQNEPPVELESNLENAIFEGPGVSGNVTDGFVFYPDSVTESTIIITCSASSSNGCDVTTEQQIFVKFTPGVEFEIGTTCISDEGGPVAFENTSSNKLLVKDWLWNFGDPQSGGDNQSDLINPTHIYSAPGDRSITLTATTLNGCTVAYTMDTIIGNRPVADFTWASECFAGEAGTQFINKTTSEFTAIESSRWVFKNKGGTVLGEVDADPPDGDVSFFLEEVDRYSVELYAMNASGCSDTLVKEITLKPTIKPNATGYDEGFNTTQGLWTNQSEDELASWVWDVPNFTGHTPVAGDKAWYTELPSGIVNYMEHSWMLSPCFDLSEMKRPLIQMDMMRSFVPGENGAVLQYMDVSEEGWKTVGESTPGIEWYNLSEITNKPGGSSVGWGLEVFNPDTDWVTASHDLDMLAGKSNVSFRVAIATTGAQGSGNQGFAFDNVYIAERSKLAVLEHFTNSSDAASKAADEVVDEFGSKYPGDVIDIQYHMSIPGEDPMNANNQLVSSARRFSYGLPQVPYAILDGGASSEFRYDFSELKTTPDIDQIRLLSLQIPKFDVQLEVDWLESILEATTTVTCKVDHYANDIDLYVVVIETSVDAYTGLNGDSTFRNVVLDMLPLTGELLGDDWSRGNNDIRVNSWIYPSYVEDVDDLAVVAFVQDRDTKQILQAAVSYKTPLVGTAPKPAPGQKIGSLMIYPNPARDMANVNLGSYPEKDGRFEIIDMNGRVVHQEMVPGGHRIYNLDIQLLDRGLYLIQWYEAGILKSRSKLIVTD